MFGRNRDELSLVVRRLEKKVRSQEKKLEELCAEMERKQLFRDRMFTKVIPAVCALAVAYAALATLFHWG